MIKYILLAEDDRGTAFTVKIQLEANGYTVFTASNGLEALKILAKTNIDLLITDVVMPEMDGVDLYTSVKNNPLTEQLPIIIVTDKSIFKESFSALGVSYFVEKTSDISKLLETIKQIASEKTELKHHNKVLISGGHSIVLDKMRRSLQDKKCLVTVANNSVSIITNAMVMIPHIIIIDALYQDNYSASELVRALRSFDKLRNTKIYTYAFFYPEEFGIDVGALGAMEESINLCSRAGVDQYIGRFNQPAFIEKLSEWGI